MGRGCGAGGRARRLCPVGGYRPLHQPLAVLWLYHMLPSLPWFSFIATLCLGHCGVSAVGGPPCAWSHWLAASTCTLTLAKSVPRRVTRTSCPLSVAFSVMLTGASGSPHGALAPWDGSGVRAASDRSSSGIPVAGASSGARTRAATRV